MRVRPGILPIICAALLGGCTTRWHPETRSPLTLVPACPNRRAPNVTDFGAAGVRAAYHFVTEGASGDDLGALIQNSRTQGFNLAMMTVNINGRDTVFATGPAVLHDQREVDAEFNIACRLGSGSIYLTHVRYNPADSDQRQVRVR